MSEEKRVVVGRSPEEWQAILSRYERCGQSVREFCLAEDVAPSTFWWWRRKLDRSGSGRRSVEGALFVELTGDRPAKFGNISPCLRPPIRCHPTPHSQESDNSVDSPLHSHRRTPAFPIPCRPLSLTGLSTQVRIARDKWHSCTPRHTPHTYLLHSRLKQLP